MTQDKDLLLKYLCMALPYRVIVQYKGHNTIIKNKILTGSDLDCNIEYYKPYLRSMSSMTEEEISKLFDILHTDKEWKDADCVKINDALGIKFFFPKGKRVEDIAEAFNYLNSIHIDFMGLIPKGLAIEINDKNNPY